MSDMNPRALAFCFQGILLLLAGFSLPGTRAVGGAPEPPSRFPADNARNVNPDTHLQLTFQRAPVLGSSGQIRIYDAEDNRLVDLLDLSIPPGPTAPTRSPDATYTPVPYQYVSGHFTNANTKPGTPSGLAAPESGNYQRTIIGGFTDAFHFYPVIIHDETATIHPHNNLLQYGKTYYVEVDPGVFIVNNVNFPGISGETDWRFSTKRLPPPIDSRRLVVNGDGSADFNTVQGAIDSIPDNSTKPVTVFIKKGKYEEIVYFRNKANIAILGEDRDNVVVHYANNEIFNPHPVNIKTNEVPGTFPSRRSAFAVDHCRGIHLVNLTIKTTAYGQAEGLLLNGEQVIISNVTIVGSGDALQSNGPAYFTNTSIVGDGDTILGRGPAFFHHCDLSSIGPFMWIRNTADNHGNVFVNCKFQTRGSGQTVIARAPTNGGKNYPFSEAVLINCQLAGIDPAGWGPIGDASSLHYWEYNSTNLSDGKPADVSWRHPASRQLREEKDAGIIAKYQDPAYVLGGWTPKMAPLILSPPQSTQALPGQAVTFRVQAAGVPDPSYQWLKNGKAIHGATDAALVLSNVRPSDAGMYSVRVSNGSGSITSGKAALMIGTGLKN